MNPGDLIAVGITLVFMATSIVLGLLLIAERRDRRFMRGRVQQRLILLWPRLLPVLDRSGTGQTTEERLVVDLVGVINDALDGDIDGKRLAASP